MANDFLEIALKDDNHDIPTLISNIRNHQRDACAIIESASIAIQTPLVSALDLVELSTALGSMLPKLKNLMISSSVFGMYHFPFEALAALGGHSPTLETLRLRILSLPLTNDDKSPYQDAANGLRNHCSLKEFQIVNCKLKKPEESDNEDGASDSSDLVPPQCPLDYILRALVTMPRLERVSLSASDQDSLGSISPLELAALAVLPTLKELEVRRFSLTSKHIVSTARSIVTSTSLLSVTLGICETLQVSENQADVALATMLRQNTSLEHFVFLVEDHPSRINNDGTNGAHNSGTGESFLTHMAHALQTNTTMRDFCLWGKLSKDTHAAFATALKHNFFLTSFWLDDAGEDDRINIDLYLSLNQDELRQRLFWNDDATTRTEWLEQLMARQNCLDAIYYLLRVKPSLMQG